MREHFDIKEILRPVMPSELKSLETHCFELMQRVLAGGVTEKLNYLPDGIMAEMLHTDGKRYRIEIKPIKNKEELVA